MGTATGRALPATPNERSLRVALVLTAGFLLAEVIGGLLTGSLALISDAAHMFTDAAALAIALAAIRIGRRPADSRRTFGYHRFEILAAAFNALLLFAVAAYILIEAYQRLRSSPEIQSVAMLAIAALGLVVNLFSMRLLNEHKDRSLNVKGAYLEVWSDMLGSIGVIAGAVLIWLTGWTWIDSLIAVAIGLWVLPRTWVLLKETLNILLEGVPEGIDLAAIEEALCGIAGVREVHDLHVWAISSGRTSLSAHLVMGDSDRAFGEVLDAARLTMFERFGIAHSTFQLEPSRCVALDEAVRYVDVRDLAGSSKRQGA